MKNQEFKKGAWSREEDSLLRRCIEIHGEGKWYLVSKRAGLNRCRKSCRLRWFNYLKADVNQEKLREDEIDLLIRMHKLLGNRWSLIAGRLPGRTANGIKNYWNTYLKKLLESQHREEEEEEPERHRVVRHQVVRHQVVRPIPRYPTTVIGTGGPIIVSENQHHQLHNEQPQAQPPPAEQNVDPVILNNDNTIWWNDDTFNFFEDVIQNPVVSYATESTHACTGMEGIENNMFHDIPTGMEKTMFEDSSIDWETIFVT